MHLMHNNEYGMVTKYMDIGNQIIFFFPIFHCRNFSLLFKSSLAFKPIWDGSLGPINFQVDGSHYPFLSLEARHLDWLEKKMVGWWVKKAKEALKRDAPTLYLSSKPKCNEPWLGVPLSLVGPPQFICLVTAYHQILCQLCKYQSYVIICLPCDIK